LWTEFGWTSLPKPAPLEPARQLPLGRKLPRTLEKPWLSAAA